MTIICWVSDDLLLMPNLISLKTIQQEMSIFGCCHHFPRQGHKLK